MIKGFFGPVRQEVEEKIGVYFVQRTASINSDSRFFLLVCLCIFFVY